jgi:murein DD-endopeptidase MepM/ murein hydrolase activator NlpD
MIRLSINLPNKRRLDLALVKRRGRSLEAPLVPDLGKILRARKGSKISRYFRYIFEHKKIKKILGTNIALILIISSFTPTRANSNLEPEQTIIVQEKTPLTTKSGVRYPVEKVIISQGYRFYHPALDFDGTTGDPIYPVMAGVVESISYSRFAYGNAIIINHGNKITSLYAHLSKIEVKKGQKVTTNTKIGEMGATGRASGDHLHLEIRDHHYPLNPYTILPQIRN